MSDANFSNKNPAHSEAIDKTPVEQPTLSNVPAPIGSAADEAVNGTTADVINESSIDHVNDGLPDDEEVTVDGPNNPVDIDEASVVCRPVSVVDIENNDFTGVNEEDSQSRRSSTRDSECPKKAALIAIIVVILIAIVTIPVVVLYNKSKTDYSTAEIIRPKGTGYDSINRSIFFEKVNSEKKKRDETMRTRSNIIEKLKAVLTTHKVKYLKGGMSACLAKQLTKSCMKGDEVQFINSAELHHLAELILPLGDQVNAKFEIEVLILFKQYCAKHKVEYESYDTFQRYLYQFRRDVIRMERNNKNKDRTYTMGYHTIFRDNVRSYRTEDIEYGDLSKELAGPKFEHTPLSPAKLPKSDTLKPTLDLREDRYVPDIKSRNKSKCVAGLALAAAAMYDLLVLIKESKSVAYSAQQLLDCGDSFQDSDKVDLKTAFEYFKDKNLCLEAQYPFTGTKSKCQSSKCKEKSIVKNVVKIEHDKAEEHLKTNGPFVTVFYAPKEFHEGYKGGISRVRFGYGQKVAALVVGHGKDAKGNKYWIAQNAWNPDPNWGEGGYFRVSDDAANDKKGMFVDAYGITK